MKLGLVSAILAEMNFEEVIDYVAENNLECVELMCWPKGEAERRYAGVTHIDVDKLNQEKVNYIKSYCKERNVEISALGYYPNTMDPDLEKRNFYIEHIKKLVKVANLLGVNLVTTFLGRVPDKTVEENLEICKDVWEPIIGFAEKNKVKIAIENCPMLFTNDEWPGGKNLMTTPYIWEKVFELIPSSYFGLNYDPSHFVWQQLDYIQPVYEFADRIFHIHFKDVKLFKDKLNRVGIMATPLQYMKPKIPPFGDIKWEEFVSALTDIGYKGYACIEIEDKAFESSLDEIKKSINLSINYMRQYV